MSQWFDLSNNANKLRQSYLKGFLDISGGGLYMRSDNSLNFYTTADGVNPAMAIDATNINVNGKRFSSDAVDSYVDVSNSKLAFLKDLSENVQLQADQLYHRTQYIRSDLSANELDTADNTAIIHIKKDATDVSKNQIIVTGHIIPKYAETYDLGSESNPFNSLYLKKNTIYFDDATDGEPMSSMSFNTTTGTLDISFNGLQGNAVISYSDKVAIGHHPNNRSPIANLDVSGTLRITGDVSFNSNLVVGSEVSMYDNLLVSKDVSLNSKLFVKEDVSLNSTMHVGGPRHQYNLSRQKISLLRKSVHRQKNSSGAQEK